MSARLLKGNLSLQHGDIPAAAEISEECCNVLERAGDALAIRLEVSEEKVEKGKWGDSWLLTQDVCRFIEKRRKKEGGEEAMDEVLPAVNFLNLSNWLELSKEIFMNAGESQKGDNWRAVAEAGETPGIRATAFEDFHSLTVNITKRIVSTVLFCAMSRIRAKGLYYTKTTSADVSPDDVEAALNILKLKHDSIQFWASCAKRNHLNVFNDDDDGGSEVDYDRDSNVFMVYDEVEASLRKSKRNRSRSRSRSISRPPRVSRSMSEIEENLEAQQAAEYTELSESNLDDDPSADDYRFPSSNPNFGDDYNSESSRPRSSSSRSNSRSSSRRPDDTLAIEAAQENYTLAVDLQTSLGEESRLWTMLNQTPPFDLSSSDITCLERPKQGQAYGVEIDDWRRTTEYWSHWEKNEMPVPEEAFMRNRKRLSRIGEKKVALVAREMSGNAIGDNADLVLERYGDRNIEREDEVLHENEGLQEDED